MNLTEATTVIELATLTTTTVSDRHRALRAAGQLFCMQTKCSRKEGSKTLSAGVAEVDLSSLTTFRPECFISAEIGYVDKGTWTSGTVYAARDLVIGDGDPDAYLYVCLAAHTAASDNQPPDDQGAYWQKVQWKRGTPVQNMGYRQVSQALRYGYLNDDQRGEEGIPRAIGFLLPSTKCYLFPAPVAAYRLDLLYWEPFISFTPGITGATSDLVTLNIPDPYLEAVLWHGAPAFLETPDENLRQNTIHWQRFTEAINQAIGTIAGVSGPILHKNPNRFF